MAKKPEKMAPYEIDAALQQVARAGGPLDKALDLIAAAGDRAPRLMVHALCGAARKGHVELVKTFLEHGVKLDDDSNFPVAEAASHGHVEIVRLLLEAGANPNVGRQEHGSDRETKPDGGIPIFEAIRLGLVDVVAALIEGGADVNAVSFCQRTPIDAARAVAASKTASKIIALLEAAGAKTVATDMLDMRGAIEANAVARVAELAKRERRAALVEALDHACSWEARQDCVAAILKHGKQKLTDADRAVGLCRAAALGRLPALRVLLEAGVPVDTLSSNDELALVAAAQRGCADSIELLLAAGADVNRATEHGKTALHGAAGYFGDEGAVVVKQLLAAGADPTLRDRRGRTALDEAKQKDSAGAIAILKKHAPGKQRTAAQIKASVKKKLAAHVRTTALPVFSSKQPAKPSSKTKQRVTPVAATGSRFGGCPGLREDESWPICDGCDCPLAFFFQLDTSELPTGHPLKARSKKAAKLVQFFFCTDCEPSSSDDTAGNGAALLRAVPASEFSTVGVPPRQHEPFVAKPIGRWSTSKEYPSPREIGGEPGYPLQIAIDIDERKALEQLQLTTAGTKSGGWPKWLQDARYPKHGKQQLDQLVLQLDLGGPLPYEFGDGGIGFVCCATGDPTKLGFVWQCL